jgi:hypothetical protein
VSGRKTSSNQRIVSCQASGLLEDVQHLSDASTRKEIAPAWLPISRLRCGSLRPRQTRARSRAGSQKLASHTLRHEAVRPLANEPNLECDPGVHLHDPRPESIRELTKPCVIHAGLQPGEVGMVEGIKHVGPDLQFNVFVEREIPGNAEV